MRWCDTLSAKPDLIRFHSIHERLLPHRLWQLCNWRDTDSTKMYAVVKLGILPVVSGICLQCDCECDDIVLHQILKCEVLQSKRDRLYETLFDNLSIEKYMDFENCNDDELLLVTILGGITVLVKDMDLSTWTLFLTIITRGISSWNLQFIMYL